MKILAVLIFAFNENALVLNLVDSLLIILSCFLLSKYVSAIFLTSVLLITDFLLGSDLPFLKYLNNSSAKSLVETFVFFDNSFPLIISKSSESYLLSSFISDNILANSTGVVALFNETKLSTKESYTLVISDS